MDPEKSRTLEDYLIEKVKESGYPLEIEISTLLDKEYVVFNTQYYFDEEIKQGRDIDIYAIPYANLDFFTDDELVEKTAPFLLRNEIAVECKKSKTYAWVFFTRPLVPVTFLHISGQYLDKFSQTDTPSLVESLFFDKLVLHYDEFKEAAIAYDEIKKKKAKKEGKAKSKREIFKGVNQLVKFICYEKGSPAEPNVFKKDFRIWIFFPIIVFDGDMYRVNLELGEPKLEKKKHILVKTSYRSPYTKKVETFLVDVIHHSYFPEFMKKLNLDFLRIRNVILQHHDELVKKAEETKRKYESDRKAKPRYTITK